MRTLIVGHRGSKGTTPENTLLSFKRALETGCDGLERDVHLSKDGVPVVIHDETLDRTTDGKGLVGAHTLEQLKHVDAGSWFDQAYKGETIPTLAEVLDLLRDHQFAGMLNFELKTDEIAYPEIEETVLALVAAYRPSYRVVYSSFNYQTLERLHQLNPAIEFGILFEKIGQELEQLHSGQPVQAWHGRYTLLNKLLRSNKKGIPLRLWTVNSYFDLRYCMSKQVETIITDYPARAMKVRKQIQGE